MYVRKDIEIIPAMSAGTLKNAVNVRRDTEAPALLGGGLLYDMLVLKVACNGDIL